jgi:hypothetical protein
MLSSSRLIVMAMALGWLIPSAAAQQAVTKGTGVLKATATIQAIDQANRVLTLRMEDGSEETGTVGPEVTRFNELKVGDRVSVSYYESTVYQIRKPGQPAPTPSATATGTTGTGPRPGATLARQTVSSVTVKAIDPSMPSITVATSDGRTVTRRVENKANLTGVQVGDAIDITYTQAAVVSVEAAK